MKSFTPPEGGKARSSKENITRAAGAVGLATLISRILGFIRDMIIANLFGARVSADAFFVAFRIPNLLRRLTAEGAMTAAFVPVFTDALNNRGKKNAYALLCNIISISLVVLVVVSVLGMIYSPLIVRMIAPGFASDPDTFELTSTLTRYLFPYLLLISISAILMGALNSLGRFFIPAAAPALLNISVITCALTLSDKFDEPTMALAVGVLIGGVFQLIAQATPLIKLGWRYVPSFSLKDQDTRKVGLLMVPAAFGMAVAELNIFVDTMLASLLPEGSVSYLYYGNRVTQFPLGVFGVAVGIAALPSMSGEVARGATEKLAGLLSHSLRLILFISIPSMVGLIALAGPITNVLFERGEFDVVAREGTVMALIFYSLGLVAFSGVKVVVSAFYAMKNTSTPTRVAAWCMVLNVALNIALMIPLKHGGLALATSISSMVNFLTLLWLLRKELGSIEGGKIIKAVTPVIVASICMAGAVWGYAEAFFMYDASSWGRVFHLMSAITIGVLVYSVVTITLGSEEALAVKNRFMAKLGLK